jgi:hypothetical protein
MVGDRNRPLGLILELMMMMMMMVVVVVVMMITRWPVAV